MKIYTLIDINKDPEVVLGRYRTYDEARKEQRLRSDVYINDMEIVENEEKNLDINGLMA